MGRSDIVSMTFFLLIEILQSLDAQPSDDNEMIRIAKSRKVHAFFYLWYSFI
jgi:hypothetical protein